MRSILIGSLCCLIGCAESLCGCSEPRTGLYVTGTLRTAALDPVSGWRVRAQWATGACSLYQPSYDEAVSDRAGRVTLWLRYSGRDSICVRLFARDTAALAVEHAIEGPLRVRGARAQLDTVSVPLILVP